LDSKTLNEQLFEAVDNIDGELCRRLLAQGASVHAVNENGSTPLHIAANNEQTDFCALLVEAGAVVEAVDNFGLTPLCLVRNMSPFAYLVEQGADPFFVHPKRAGGLSPFLLIVREATPDSFDDDVEIFEACIEQFGRERVFSHLPPDGLSLEQFASGHPDLVARVRTEFLSYQTELAIQTATAIEGAIDEPAAGGATRSRGFSLM
jgi:hypothetical protein